MFTLNSTKNDVRMVLTAVALTYVSLGVILGFVQGGIAPILRTQGMDLSSMRWVYMLYLPFGIAFLWAPVIDSWRFPWLGKRTGWIIPMQYAAAFVILVISYNTPGTASWGALLILGIVGTFAAATVDIALDALTVEIVPDAQRAAAAAAKMGGISVGSVLGGGILVAHYSQLQWHGVMWTIATLVTLSCLPIFPLIAKDRLQSKLTLTKRANIRQMLRKPAMKMRLIRLTLLICMMLALFNFHRLLLVDMGVSLEEVGSVLGTAAPLVNAMACVLTPFLIRLLSLRISAILMVIVCLVSANLVWLGSMQGNSALVMFGSVLTTAGASALYVVLGGLILEWAIGDQAATDYALLYGLGRFIGTVVLVMLPGLIEAVGWLPFQGGVIISFLASACYFLALFPKKVAKHST